jgi:hypothetical protein
VKTALYFYALSVEYELIAVQENASMLVSTSGVGREAVFLSLLHFGLIAVNACQIAFVLEAL